MEALKTPKKSFSKTAHPASNKTSISPIDQSFDQTYKSSYSHGLEAIYKLENIDIKTVRPIEIRTKPLPEATAKPKLKSLPPQNELDLGPYFRDWIEPFVNQEPIQVLGLSKHAEKSLIDNQKTHLRHLIESDLQTFIYYKGLGQGHVDEIRQKLSEYIAYKPIKQTNTLDIQSWIKSLVASYDKRKIYVLLEKYQLNEIINLSPLETVEVKRLTLEKKLEWIEEITSLIVQPHTQKKVLEQIQTIIDTFIKPWMRSRGYLATSAELMERIERISEQPKWVEQTLTFLSEVFLSKQNIFNKTLVRLEDHLYGSDLWVLNSYLAIVDKAKSYFYHEDVVYYLNELKYYLEREFAKQWVTFEKIFFDKALKLSSLFKLKLNEKREVQIILCQY